LNHQEPSRTEQKNRNKLNRKTQKQGQKHGNTTGKKQKEIQERNRNTAKEHTRGGAEWDLITPPFAAFTLCRLDFGKRGVAAVRLGKRRERFLQRKSFSYGDLRNGGINECELKKNLRAGKEKVIMKEKR
jgi:hypothetical protein